MLKYTKRAVLFASMLLVSAGLAGVGTTARADPGDAQVTDSAESSGQASVMEREKPEAAGRVIRRTKQVADEVSSLQQAVADSSDQAGLAQSYTPEAGGRVIRRTKQVADAVSSLQQSAADSSDQAGLVQSYTPEAGGRVIRRTKRVADAVSSSQQASALACTTEAKVAKNC